MAVQTRFSGNIKRYNGDDIERQHPFSSNLTVTEGGDGRIVVAPGSKDVSVMPAGLLKATTVYIDCNGKLNVELTGESVASFDVLSGNLILNGSLSNVRLWNQNATPSISVYYDISG